MTRKERTILLLLSALNFTHILDFMIMMPLGNYLMPYFQLSTQEFAFLVSAYTFSAGISGFLAAFFVDNYDRKKILIWAYAGFLLGTIACGIAPTFMLLMVARIVAGIFGGLIGAQVISIVSDTFAYEKRGQAMGMVMSAFSIASILGVPFSLYLANLISWHAPFLLVGGLGFVILPLLWRYIPSMTAHIHTTNTAQESKIQILTNVIKTPIQRNAILFSGLVIFGHFLIIPFINPYMEFNLGYSKSQTPMVYLVGGIASFLSANILGKVADKHGKLKIFSLSIWVALPMILFITNMPNVPYYLILTVFGLWFMASTGRGITAQALVSQVVNPEHRGSFQSFNSGMQQLGSGLAALIAGFIIVKAPDGHIDHYNWVGYLSVATLLGCLILGRRIFKTFDEKE